MDIQGPKRHPSKARQRYLARQEKRDQRRAQTREATRRPGWQGEVLLRLQDALWYMDSRRGWLWRSVGAAVVVIVLMFFLTYTASGRIYPNVVVMGVDVGGMTLAEAQTRLNEAWAQELQIEVVVDGNVEQTVAPGALGFQLDAAETANAAKAVNWRDGFFGVAVAPSVTLTDSGYLALQDYLLNMTETINYAPYNAGFKWQGDTLVAEMGRAGRLMDIAPTLAAVRDDPAAVVGSGILTVYVSPVQPDVQDPSAYLASVQRYAQQQFVMVGYDPYRDATVRWSTNRETFTSWLEVDGTGLALRENAFAAFIDLQNESLNSEEAQAVRYLNVEETMQDMRDAIANQVSEVSLRVRYHPQEYVVEAGDTASKIARKTGIPFYLIEQHNAGRDLDVLSIGDTLTMPTRDVTMPNPPVADKRIVVNLNTQELWAFENEEIVFNWRISSGRSDAPTSPGIYQILNHDPTAYGSSFSLCSDSGCGQWEMYWFMGMYEVVPGLMNGFHGAVLLPNGAYLNGGDVGYPSTFGCVMSVDDQAKALYDWAEVGTVVEIISEEFAPMSDLAARTQET